MSDIVRYLYVAVIHYKGWNYVLHYGRSWFVHTHRISWVGNDTSKEEDFADHGISQRSNQININ